MEWNDPKIKSFVKAILSLETADETKRFLRDLMTEGEIEEFGKRLRTAELLVTNTPYSVITKETGLSSTTIARVSKWLNGEEGGYRTILHRLHHPHTKAKFGKI